jgi:acyl-CoA thioesterase FadM
VDELVVVRLKLRQMTRRTLTFEVVIENEDGVKAKGKIRTVCVQGREDRFKSIPIPEVIRKKIRLLSDENKNS